MSKPATPKDMMMFHIKIWFKKLVEKEGINLVQDRV
jgi:hypothetical protein